MWQRNDSGTRGWRIGGLVLVLYLDFYRKWSDRDLAGGDGVNVDEISTPFVAMDIFFSSNTQLGPQPLVGNIIGSPSSLRHGIRNS